MAKGIKMLIKRLKIKGNLSNLISIIFLINYPIILLNIKHMEYLYY